MEKNKLNMNANIEKSNDGGCGCGCSGDVSTKKPIGILGSAPVVKTQIAKPSKPFVKPAMASKKRVVKGDEGAQLMQWPVQFKIMNIDAPYFKDADLLIAADCTAYAYANFHKDFIKGRITVIGCPKLDDVEFYKNKLAQLVEKNNIKSIKVVRMSVPCCKGITDMAKEALLSIKRIIPYEEVQISPEGEIVSKNF